MKVKYFVTRNGDSPFEEWFTKLDKPFKAIVVRSIQKVANGGSKKSIKSLKDGIFEIKIVVGPGYRIYFGYDGENIIILIVWGDKKTQGRDIIKAKKYWSNHGK